MPNVATAKNKYMTIFEMSFYAHIKPFRPTGPVPLLLSGWFIKYFTISAFRKKPGKKPWDVTVNKYE